MNRTWYTQHPSWGLKEPCHSIDSTRPLPTGNFDSLSFVHDGHTSGRSSRAILVGSPGFHSAKVSQHTISGRVFRVLGLGSSAG